MSPSSSTSVSDRRAKRYLAVAAAIVGVALLLNMAASLYAIRTNLLSWHVAALFAYQTGKLKTGPPVDILLLGDSSLGNAIDARRWSASTGMVVEGVALTGQYG